MIDTSKVYTSRNCGDFIIVNYVNSNHVTVKFCETGFTTIVQSRAVYSGSIKDKLMPSISGIGFIGDGRYRSYANGGITKPYQTWVDMLRRCYDPVVQLKFPTYKNCKVCIDWHNFQNFAEWFEANYKEGLHLDKDISVDGNKIYSPEYCSFVTRCENNEKAKAKKYKMKSPDGRVVDIYNMDKFCRDNSLSPVCMCRVYAKKQKSHKGWLSV